MRGFLGCVRWCDEESSGKPNEWVDQINMFLTGVWSEKKKPRNTFGWIEKYTDLQEISALNSYTTNLNASQTYRMNSIFFGAALK